MPFSYVGSASRYPHGLKRDEIHESAQIVAIADVYDALSNFLDEYQ